jgi:hypothetical protein
MKDLQEGGTESKTKGVLDAAGHTADAAHA